MRILVVEDDRKISAFMAKGLKQAGFAVDVADNGQDGLRLGVQGLYDAAVVDVMLPGLDGLAMIERLRDRKIRTPVIILSAKHTVDDRVRGLQAGGDDYLTKPFSFSELLARIQALIRRSSGAGETFQLAAGGLTMNLLTREVQWRGQPVELQAREYALLEYFMRNPKRVVSKTCILEHVYDYNFDPQTNIVDVLVCRLRAKLDAVDATNMIHTLRGMGYVLKPD